MRYDIDFLFCVIDDFCKMYEEWEQHRLIPTSGTRRRPGVMSLSELMTIMVLFHVSPCKNFKWFYLAYLPLKHGKDFPNRVSYTRFVALQSRLFLPLQLLLHSLRGEETGLYFMDATSLPVCHNKRIKRHRVFDGMAKRGRTTMGWFFGFKALLRECEYCWLFCIGAGVVVLYVLFIGGCALFLCYSSYFR